MRKPILQLRDVTAGYGSTHVLKQVSLSLTQGERLAIIGRNGAGKTTLMSTIMGLTRLHAGDVSLDGQSVSHLAPFQRNQRGLGLVPQTRDIFPSLTVEENLLCAMHPDSSLEEAYALFPRLKARRGNGGTQLSGGEQQMLAIARTLMSRPKILLLDEPLEGLAPVICELLMDAFESLTRHGDCTVVLVEQHVEAALDFADRVILLSNGQVVFDGAKEQLQNQPDMIDRYVGVGLSA